MDLFQKYKNWKISPDKCFVIPLTKFKNITFYKRLIWSKLPEMGQKNLFYSETCVLGIRQLYTVADISARERERCQVTKIFNRIILFFIYQGPSYSAMESCSTGMPSLHVGRASKCHRHAVVRLGIIWLILRKNLGMCTLKHEMSCILTILQSYFCMFFTLFVCRLGIFCIFSCAKF